MGEKRQWLGGLGRNKALETRQSPRFPQVGLFRWCGLRGLEEYRFAVPDDCPAVDGNPAVGVAELDRPARACFPRS